MYTGVSREIDSRWQKKHTDWTCLTERCEWWQSATFVLILSRISYKYSVSVLINVGHANLIRSIIVY